MIVLTVLSQPGCHLCDEMLEELRPLIADKAQVRLIDINDNEELLQQYCLDIPVLLHDKEEICRHRLNPVRLQQYLQSRAS